MGKPRYMPFWAEDWLTSESIERMTPAEEGAYIRLLAKCWIDKDCTIPDDERWLNNASRLGQRGWSSARVLRELFVSSPRVPGRLHNPRLTEIRREDDEYREDLSNSGKKGAEARWRGHGDAIAEPSVGQWPPPPSPSPSPLTTKHTRGAGAPPPSEDAFQLSDELRQAILTYKPDHKLCVFPTATREAWACIIDRMVSLDRRSVERIRAVIDYLPTSVVEGPGRWRGWAPNVQSADALRKHFDKIELEMTRGGGGAREETWEECEVRVAAMEAEAEVARARGRGET